MKKGKFNGLSFDNLEKLSRDEQKKVVGGYGPIANPYPPKKICVRWIPVNGGGYTSEAYNC